MYGFVGSRSQAGALPYPSGQTLYSVAFRPEPRTSRVSGYNRAGGPEWNSPMYVFANEGPLIQVRAPLVRGADGPHGKMCWPQANMG